jgi:hypothetical protein
MSEGVDKERKSRATRAAGLSGIQIAGSHQCGPGPVSNHEGVEEFDLSCRRWVARFLDNSNTI